MNWDAFRSEMPVTEKWAYFDHAAVAPLTARARHAMTEWADDLASNGDIHEPQWLKRVEDVRLVAARLINGDPRGIAFVKNTSEGIGIVAEGFPWRPGDNIVTAAEEYPANIYPWMNLRSKGVETRLVPSRDRRIWLDDIIAHTDDRTRVVSLSAVEFSTGFRNDLDAIGSFCRERKIHFFVDAIQALGVLPIDVQKTPIDFLSADGHKWMLAPEGAGIFYIRHDLIDMLHPVGIGWNSVVDPMNFSRIDFTLKPDASRWESGTLNVPGILGMGASLALLLDIGIDAIAQRAFALTDYLCTEAVKQGLEVYSSRRPEDKSSIVSLIVPKGKPSDLVRSCRAVGIAINHRGGRLRISPHFYNSHEEIDRLLQHLRSAS